jgi:putative colanic acid biosynthesis UDP-glucose lipid carrier transferase
MNVVIKIIDVLLIGMLLYLIVTGYGVSHPHYTLIGFSAAILYVLLSEVVNAHVDYYSTSLLRETTVTTILWLVVVSTVITTLFVFKESATFSRFVILVWSASVPVAFFIWRLLARKLISPRIMQSGRMPKAVIVGTGKLGNKVKKVLQGSPWFGFKFIGHYDDRQAPGRTGCDKDIIGDFRQMMYDAKQGRFDVVFIALPIEAQVRIKTIIDNFGDTTITVYMVPDFYFTDFARGGWHDFGGLPVVGVFDTPFWGASSVVKRSEDIVKPGITGWAQISGWRGETDTIYKMEKRIEHDLWYLNNWSLWLDIKTIFLTISKGFTGKNAY